MITKAKKSVKRFTTNATATKKASPKTTKTSPAKTGAGTIEKQIADVIKLIPDATMVIDPKGKVMAWNHAMEELTGVRAKDIIGKGDYEYSLPFYGERRPVLADIALKEAGDLRKKYKSITPWGNTLVAELRVTNLPKGPATVYGSATLFKKLPGKSTWCAGTGLRGQEITRKIAIIFYSLPALQNRPMGKNGSMGEIIKFKQESFGFLVGISPGRVLYWILSRAAGRELV